VDHEGPRFCAGTWDRPRKRPVPGFDRVSGLQDAVDARERLFGRNITCKSILADFTLSPRTSSATEKLRRIKAGSLGLVAALEAGLKLDLTKGGESA